MYQHILIPTDGSELAERGVTDGLSLAKFVGAKVTAIIVEERPDAWWGIGGPFPNPGQGVAFVELTEEIKKHAASVLVRVANPAKRKVRVGPRPCGNVFR